MSGFFFGNSTHHQVVEPLFTAHALTDPRKAISICIKNARKASSVIIIFLKK